MQLGRHRPNPGGLLSLIQHLRARRPSILQTLLYHADFLGTDAAFFARPEHLLWNVRSSKINQPEIAPLTRCLVRLLAVLSKRPDAIVINSQDGQVDHSRLGYRPKQWINIPNGVDLDRFRPRRNERMMLRDRLGFPADAAVIGFVARYHPMKDVETFLRAASLFQQVHENAKFVLCGDGLSSDNLRLKVLARAIDLDGRMVLLGLRSDIELIYPALDIFTLCSISGEGFPNVLCEAMACDVPCVATDVGDSAEIIGDCGLIVPKRDHEALAHAWHALLEKPSRSRTETPRSRITARYSLEKMRAQYESFYRSLTRKPPKARYWH